ncbi:hypothetical protein SAMN05216474_2472 [Lishizhenia tianjinensis]|uniref:Uncharacterized protein n=1 Tax=Lishizhenia tianjinensis TaxID=477690 RepID=A0A1I7B1R5_9FLAO|nr:hypothetical protein [Lishizhenia tianjinensis]SFT81156.1 hypothetical protein SAMN05216474_2472 [Lishizhenia tianjinensis]
MHALILKTLVIGMLPLSSCLFSNSNTTEVETSKTNTVSKDKSVEPHRYGGWYCPDNLNTFPAVNLSDWNTVPAIENRLPTEEEAKSGASLILVDTEKYPKAKALTMSLPKLAKYQNPNTQREDVIIVIQAVSIQEDSIVGFRFLNGGNGSARLKEVEFITKEKAQNLSKGKFVQHDYSIKAADTSIWKLMMDPELASLVQVSFDPQNQLSSDWRSKAQLNFNYPHKNKLINSFISDDFWGNCYVQNDFDQNLYTEKFFLTYDKDKQVSTLKIVCGPYDTDYEQQEKVLTNWAKRIKDLSEFGSFNLK